MRSINADEEKGVSSSVVGVGLRTVSPNERVATTAVNSVRSAEPVDIAKLKQQVGNVLNDQQMSSMLISNMTTAILNVYEVKGPEELLLDVVRDNLAIKLSTLLDGIDPKVVIYEVEKQLIISAGEAIENILRDYTFELGDRDEAALKAGQTTSLLIKKTADFLRKERP